MRSNSRGHWLSHRKQTPNIQTLVLNGLAIGGKNAAQKPLSDASARKYLAGFMASPSALGARGGAISGGHFCSCWGRWRNVDSAGKLPPRTSDGGRHLESSSRRSVAPRDLKRGHELFAQACSACHRIGKEGHEVGPDLIGQLGMAGGRSAQRHSYAANARIRPRLRNDAGSDGGRS